MTNSNKEKEKWAIYHSIYVAINDVHYISDKKKVVVKRGMCLSAGGGGCFTDGEGTIVLANISSVNGKRVSLAYDVRTDKENFISTPDPTWIEALHVTNRIERWAQDGSRIVACGKVLDLNGIKCEINSNLVVLMKINSILNDASR